MIFKLLVIAALVIIITSLGSGLYFLIRDGNRGNRTLKALTVRIALSVGLFILLFIAAALGLITPHGVIPI